MAAVTVSTRGDQNAGAQSLNKGSGYVVFGLVCRGEFREMIPTVPKREP